jgi:hypothetical protein
MGNIIGGSPVSEGLNSLKNASKGQLHVGGGAAETFSDFLIKTVDNEKMYREKRAILEAIFKGCQDIVPNLKKTVLPDNKESKEYMEAMSVALLKELPHPDINESQFSKDKNVQKDICIKVATIINSVAGPIIKTDGVEASYICLEVINYISSLATGIYSEFLVVQQSAKNVLVSIEALNGMLKNELENLTKEFNENKTIDAVNFEKYKQLHMLFLELIQYHTALLNNMLIRADTNCAESGQSTDPEKVFVCRMDEAGDVSSVPFRPCDNVTLSLSLSRGPTCLTMCSGVPTRCRRRACQCPNLAHSE